MTEKILIIHPNQVEERCSWPSIAQNPSHPAQLALHEIQTVLENADAIGVIGVDPDDSVRQADVVVLPSFQSPRIVSQYFHCGDDVVLIGALRGEWPTPDAPLCLNTAAAALIKKHVIVTMSIIGTI